MDVLKELNIMMDDGQELMGLLREFRYQIQFIFDLILNMYFLKNKDEFVKIFKNLCTVSQNQQKKKLKHNIIEYE